MVGKVATYYAVRCVRAPVIILVDGVVASTLLVASNYLVNRAYRSDFRARNATFRVLSAPAGKYLPNLQMKVKTEMFVRSARLRVLHIETKAKQQSVCIKTFWFTRRQC